MRSLAETAGGRATTVLLIGVLGGAGLVGCRGNDGGGKPEAGNGDNKDTATQAPAPKKGFEHPYNKDAGVRNATLGNITCKATLTKNGSNVHVHVDMSPPGVEDVSVAYSWSSTNGTVRGENTGTDFEVAGDLGRHVSDGTTAAHFSWGSHGLVGTAACDGGAGVPIQGA